MKASKTLLATLRESPAEASVDSHKLMIRSGLVRTCGSGLYHYLPFGLRVIQKIEKIIREEMNASGALEFLLPILTPAELWQRSGRWDSMGREMFRIQDRHANWSALGPTHEESFTELVKGLINSYKDLPLNVYQMHTKFRDEIRPRFGVIRSREFIMKDAYSFDLDEQALDKTYQSMRRTYRRIFKRMGLETLTVQADSGAMGGSGSEEFMVPSAIGEETLLVSEGGKYLSNQEKTPVVYPKRNDKAKESQSIDKLKQLHTPNCKSIDDVAAFLNIKAEQTIKALALTHDQQMHLIFMQGDRELNEAKFANVAGLSDWEAASPERIQKAGGVAGFMGPFSIAKDVLIYYDKSIDPAKEYVVGANQVDMHLEGFVFAPDLPYKDLALAREGDLSPEGDGPLKSIKGIEVGHIFKLGRKYCEAFEVNVLDPGGKSLVPVMGCYGIGVNRAMATIIEQRHDDSGIIWPVSVAPYEVVLIGISKGAEQDQQIEELYSLLADAGIDVLYDDRNLRPGVKFKDAELIGYPIVLTAGKGFFENQSVEVKIRKSGQDDKRESLPKDELLAGVQKLIRELYEQLDVK